MDGTQPAPSTPATKLDGCSIAVEFNRTSQPEASYLVSMTVISNGSSCDVVLHRRAHSAIDALLDTVDKYFDRHTIRKILVQPFHQAKDVTASSATIKAL
jgi:hypothetical protein